MNLQHWFPTDQPVLHIRVQSSPNSWVGEALTRLSTKEWSNQGQFSIIFYKQPSNMQFVTHDKDMASVIGGGGCKPVSHWMATASKQPGQNTGTNCDQKMFNKFPHKSLTSSCFCILFISLQLLLTVHHNVCLLLFMVTVYQFQVTLHPLTCAPFGCPMREETFYDRGIQTFCNEMVRFGEVKMSEGQPFGLHSLTIFRCKWTM